MEEDSFEVSSDQEYSNYGLKNSSISEIIDLQSKTHIKSLRIMHS
jgi:hypothetical protein